MREARGLEEPGEGADVPRQPFEPAPPVRGRGTRTRARTSSGRREATTSGRSPCRRASSSSKRRQLRRHERVKAPDERPAGQEVEAPATELAGARTGEDEPPTIAATRGSRGRRSGAAGPAGPRRGRRCRGPARRGRGRAAAPAARKARAPARDGADRGRAPREGRAAATSTFPSRAARGGRSSPRAAGRSVASLPIWVAKRNLHFRNAGPRKTGSQGTSLFSFQSPGACHSRLSHGGSLILRGP